MTTDPLLKWRAEFPTLERTVHLISHSLGAMPRQAESGVLEYTRMWRERSIRAWEEAWWRMPVTVGDLIGGIIGAAPGTVVMQPNVSVAQWIALSCFDWTGRRNKLVSEGMNFPTNLYAFHELKRLGARLVEVASEDGMTVSCDSMLRAIDEQTQLVCLSHVLFRSSFVQDVAAITERAHRVGAAVLVDLYQSAGTVPVEAERWRVDFATGGSVKWLCGGPGAGYLYVRPDLIEKLRPQLTGWSAHRSPFAFASGPIEYADDIGRFQHGTPGIPALYAAQAGYRIVAEIGVDRIREKSVRQTELLIALAQESGLKVRSPLLAEERGGTVVLDVPGGDGIVRELLRRDVLVDFRPGAGIRIAPHFYTKDEELKEVIGQIISLLPR